MSWWEALPAILAAVALLVLPGLPVARAAGARGFTLLAAGFGGSVGIIALASIVAPAVGLGWSLLPVLVVTAFLTGAAFLIRRALPTIRPDAAERRIWPYALLGGLAGGAILLVALTRGIAGPDHPNQLYDAIFHLNAVQFVLDTGSASPLDMTLATPGRSSALYPTGWHALVALVAQSSASSVVVATNAVTVAVVCVLWPLGLMFLTRSLWPERGFAVAFAGVFSAGFAIFPFGFLSWGVLYPNLLANALVPFVVGLALAGLGRAPRQGLPALLAWLLAALALAGALDAHPSALFAILVIGAPLLLSVLWGAGRRISSVPGRLGLTAIGLAYIATALLLWLRLRPADAKWDPYTTVPGVLRELLWSAPIGRPEAFLLTVMIVVGAIVLLLRRSWWFLGAHLLMVGLFIVAAAVWNPALRTFLVGVWYSDPTRVAALLALTALPIAAIGADAVIGGARRLLSSPRLPSALRPLGSVRGTLAVSIAIFTVITAGSQYLVLGPSVAHLRDSAFRFDEESMILSPDEVELLEMVGEIVPEGEMVAGNPWTGTGLVYAFANREALFPHLLGDYPGERWAIAEELAHDAASLCPVLDELGIRYVLDFGDIQLIQGRGDSPRLLGLNDLAGSASLTEVASRGDAALYEITACP